MSRPTDQAARPSDKQQRLADVHDAEVAPLWNRRFERLALRAISVRPAATVLEIGCATGEMTLALAARFDGESRITALESSPPLAALAAAKLGADPAAGSKVALITTATPFLPTLILGDAEYDVCVSNLALAETPDPRHAVAELARVLKPGGELVVTLPLRGTWGEFLDIYRDVLAENRQEEALTALAAYVATFPEGETALRWMEEAGLHQTEIVIQRWELLFKSAREFFFAPVIDLGPLSRWKQIAGRGDQMQDIFFFTKQAIDAYFAGGVFAVTVVAASLKGWKPIGGG